MYDNELLIILLAVGNCRYIVYHNNDNFIDNMINDNDSRKIDYRKF